MATPSLALGIKPEIVRISLDAKGDIRCEPDIFRVSKGKKPNVCVVWVCDQPFSVDFGSKENSPFYESHFTESETCSGLVRRDVPASGEEKVYKYTVRVGGKKLDPGGKVDP
ncbi:MAG TPA: hypothetical protein VIH17_02180 [Candidatus Acidoferrales bacterium]